VFTKDSTGIQTYKLKYSNNVRVVLVVSIYVFKAKVVKTGRKYLIYPPKEYQEKLRKLHGKEINVIVIEESD